MNTSEEKYSFLSIKEEHLIQEIISYVDKEIPPNYRSDVLNFLLGRYLISPRPGIEVSMVGEQKSNQITEVEKAKKTESVIGELFKKPIDNAEYNSLFSLKGMLLEKALAVLKIAQSKGADYLSPAEITKLLKEKFRVSKVYASNISLALSKARAFVDRRPREQGQGYEYRLMLQGEKCLSDVMRTLPKE